jgi:hypothetical protein
MDSKVAAWQNAVIRAWEDGDIQALVLLTAYDPRRI